MNETMIIWFSVITLVLLAFVLRAIEKFRETNWNSEKPIKLIEMAKEKELFYCPGDEWFDTDED